MKRKLDEKYGTDGEFFVDEEPYDQFERYKLSHDDKTIVDYNVQPSTQPGLWCQWKLNGRWLEWDQGEKFYNYIEWLQYLINNFFGPHGYILSGTVSWNGESSEDIGKMDVKDNVILVYQGTRNRDKDRAKLAAKMLSGEVNIYEYNPKYGKKLNFNDLLDKINV